MGNITSRPSSSSSTRTPQSHEDHHRTFDRHDNALSQPSQQRQPSLGSSAHHADAHVDHRSSDQPPVQPRPSRLKRLSRSFTPRSSFLPSLSSSSRESQCHPTEGNNDSGSTLQGPLHRLKDRRSSRRSQQPTSPGQPGLPLGDRTNATSQPQPQVQEASQTAPCSHPDIASPEPDFTSSRRAEGDDGAGPSPQPVAEASSGPSPAVPEAEPQAPSPPPPHAFDLPEETPAPNSEVLDLSCPIEDSVVQDEQDQLLERSQTRPASSLVSESQSTAQRRSTASIPARRVMVQGTIGSEDSPTQQQTQMQTPTSPSATPPAEDGQSVPQEAPSQQQQQQQEQASAQSPSGSGLYNPAAQAVLVARLLSVASAATAASLLPGSIQVAGQTIGAFPGLGEGGESEPQSPNTPATTGHSHPPEAASSRPSQPPAVPRTTSTDGRPRLSNPAHSLFNREHLSSNLRPASPSSNSTAGRRSRSSSAPEPREFNTSSAPSTNQASAANAASSEEPLHPGSGASPREDSASSPTSPSRQGALMVSRPSLYDQPMPQATAPEGSFERFLSDLQTEVSLAILRDHFAPRRSNAAGNGAGSDTPFSFFRSFRFPERLMDESGNLTELPSDDAAAPATDETQESRLADAPPTLAQQPESALSSSPAQASTDESTQGPTPAPPLGSRVAPLLLVGVRSVAPRAAESNTPRSPTELPHGDNVMDPFSMLPPRSPAEARQSASAARSPLQEGERMRPGEPHGHAASERQRAASQEESEPLLGDLSRMESNHSPHSPSSAGASNGTAAPPSASHSGTPTPTSPLQSPQAPSERTSSQSPNTDGTEQPRAEADSSSWRRRWQSRGAAPVQGSSLPWERLPGPRLSRSPFLGAEDEANGSLDRAPWRQSSGTEQHDYFGGPQAQDFGPEATSTTNTQESQDEDTRPRDLPGNTSNTRARRQRDFVIWIAGGIYPAAHPLLLFSDLENADYNDLIRLAELIGNVKRTTATQAEVDQSGLKIVSAQELPELLASDRVLSNTVERCLVCLEDYEDAPDAELRLLECRHAFHRECVDKWLLTSKNSCPCCRSQAVNTLPDEEASASNTASANIDSEEDDPLEQLAQTMQSQSLA